MYRRQHSIHLPGLRGLLRYAIAVVSVGFVLAIALLLPEVAVWPLALLLAPVALSAWIGGGGPAALAILLSAIAASYFFVAPIHSFKVNNPLGFLLYICEGAFLAAG